jgi:DNA-binding CsgD family transcriptional regulator
VLTSRQVEVLLLSSHGRAAKEIARSLGISVRTVEGHFGAMRRRTGTRNTVELIAWGVRYGFIPHEVPGSQAASQQTADEESPETGPPEKFPDTASTPGYAGRQIAGRKTGRPTVVTPEVAAQARLLLGSYTMKQVAAKLGISRSTLYAHMGLVKLDESTAGDALDAGGHSEEAGAGDGGDGRVRLNPGLALGSRRASTVRRDNT